MGRPRSSWRSPVFEYRVQTSPVGDSDTLQDRMNALGTEGWELVSVVLVTGRLDAFQVLYWKREFRPGAKV